MSKIDKDHINRFFDYNFHFESRMIHLGVPESSDEGTHEISFHTASAVIKAILILEGESSEGITVNLMTYGGCIESSLAIYDILKACKCDITIRGMGTVYSAGALLLQAATPGKRLLYPNTQVMLHGGSRGASDHFQNFQRWADHIKKMDTSMFKIFAESCGDPLDKKTMKVDYWRKKMSLDWILTADEAVANNIADSITRSNY